MSISSSDPALLGAPGRGGVEAGGWMPTPSLRRPGRPLSLRAKLLIAGALATVPSGYFVAGGRLVRPVEIAAAPPAAGVSATPRLPLRDAGEGASAPAGEAPPVPPDPATTPGPAAPAPATPGAAATRRAATTAGPAREVTAALPPRPGEAAAPERSTNAPVATPYDRRCLPSLLAVRQSYPDARPSWTLRASGHEGTRCWYPAARTAGLPARAPFPAPTAPVRSAPVDLDADESAMAAGLSYPGCLPSAAAVMQVYPDARPSWTLRAPGHEGAKCWFAPVVRRR